MRPGNGEMSRAPACAAATAWMKPKMSVMLHVIPSFSNSRAAWMPSHVPASFTRTRERSTPSASYMAMMRRARRNDSAVSKDARMSTSVETYPGTILTISRPSSTASRSEASSRMAAVSEAIALALA
eukprot:scaffold135150_cov31-Tisochrysis_lutea.AAC.1